MKRSAYKLGELIIIVGFAVTLLSAIAAVILLPRWSMLLSTMFALPQRGGILLIFPLVGMLVMLIGLAICEAVRE